MCPSCGSLERHRFVWLYFQRQTDLFDREFESVLHVAPEPCFLPRFLRLLGPGYLTADFLDDSVMERMDITDIGHEDGAFDVIYCSHVLEHVPDDRKAIQEFRRVLKQDGWAVIMVPITSESTYEDASIVDPKGRLKHFGQVDHVRRYGMDVQDRLEESGFSVTCVRPDAFLSEREQSDCRIDKSECLFLCK